MAGYSVRGFKVQDADLKLLRVFASIVKHNGFSAAQYGLNLSLPAISSAMSQLESRLGFKLCERGRSGFVLTEGGRLVERELAVLFASIEGFQAATDAFKGNVHGQIRIGVDDCILANPNCPLPAVLRAMLARAPEMDVTVAILGAAEMEKALLERKLNIAIGPFRDISPALERTKLLDERQLLCCGSGHPAFGMIDPTQIATVISKSAYGARSYSERSPSVRDTDFGGVQITSQMEALLALVLSGKYLGYLAEHYCKPWIERGDIWSIAPQTHAYFQAIDAVFRANDDDPRTALFLECLAAVNPA